MLELKPLRAEFLAWARVTIIIFAKQSEFVRVYEY